MMITVDEPGTYTVEVTDGFCTGADTIMVICPADPFARCRTSFCPGMRHWWCCPIRSPASSGAPEVPITVLVVNMPGIYWFDAVDPFGCAWTDTILVTIIDTEVGEPIIPNVFSPERGRQNDVYLITGVDADDFELEIYNRWGMKMFSSTSCHQRLEREAGQWVRAVPDGTYYYILTFKDDCAQVPSTTLTGHVTLLR